MSEERDNLKDDSAPLGDRMDRSGERVVRVPAGGMLPGVAAIAMFMMFMTMLNVFVALKGGFGAGVGKYGVLTLATLLAVGIFGLLRLRKWGWALVTAGCLLVSTGDFFVFTRTHVTFFLVRGIFVLVFFLYLVRPETRARLQ